MPTSRKFQFSVAVLGLFANYITSAAVLSEEQVAEASDPTSQQPFNITTKPFEPQIPFRTCYVEESKVAPLVTQMSAVLRMLNNDQDYVESKLLKLKEMPKLQEYEMCSEQRIYLLTEELGWVSRRLWELSIRLEEPKDAEVQLLDKRKVDLIRHLQNVVVFTEGSSTPALAMQLESFGVKVEFLEYGFNTALVMFQTDRQVRPTLSPATLAKNAAIRSILEHSKTTKELVQISRDHIDAMSETLPELVSNWYAGKLQNFQLVLDFIKRLPKLVHQMIGYTSLYDAMSANSDLESYELTEFVLQLKEINATVALTAADIPRAVLTRYTQLVHEVWPVYQIIGRNTTCDFRNLKYERSVYGAGDIIHLYSAESSRHYWSFYTVSGSAMFTHTTHWYSSESDVFSASKRSVKYRSYVSELYGHWKLVPVKGGKFFRILNAKYDEVLFADKAEMNPSCSNCRRMFLARHDFLRPHDYEQNADLWIVDCKE